MVVGHSTSMESFLSKIYLSFSTFAWMQQKRFALANFASGKMCLCKQDQHFLLKNAEKIHLDFNKPSNIYKEP